jgi:TonB family protein
MKPRFTHPIMIPLLLWLLTTVSFSQSENKTKQEAKDTTPPVAMDAADAEKNLIYRAQAEYPPMAQRGRIEGDVVVEILISKDGSVARTRILSGHPYLVGAAMTAARQYRYRPFKIERETVDVITNVTLHFPPPKQPPKGHAASPKT